MLRVDNTWTLFLDRDGVINQRNFEGYIEHVSEFEFTTNALKAFEIFHKLFHKIVVVTNQQGVGKKSMTERNLLAIHTYMLQEINANKGRVDKVYFSADLRSKENNTRKPNPAMAEMAKEEFPEINFEKSIMVGDTDSDIIFGTNLGMTTVAIHSKEVRKVKADLEFNSLFEFATFLKEENE